MQRGHLVRRVTEIHSEYGSIVRLAPDELSFIDTAAVRDIYAHRPGHKTFPKNRIWMGDPKPGADSIVNANDADHDRIRKVWTHAFTQKALKEQESLIQGYVDQLVSRLGEEAVAHGGDVVVDMVEWFNFTTFDIIGDLGFGEPFDCLKERKYNPWMSIIFSHFKSATLMASCRFYPLVYRLLIWSLPQKTLQQQQDHFQMSKDKVRRRMNLEKQRPDFMAHVLQHNQEHLLSLEEIEATAATIIVAGSETTATFLCALTNYLLKDPAALQILVDEIRRTFTAEADITIDHLAKMPYLSAVINEGFRMAPPVPAGLPRVIPDGGDTVCGYWLPAGVSPVYPLRSLAPICCLLLRLPD